MWLFFRNFEFFPIFWKNQNFDFFSKIQFLKKLAENLSTYSNYEFLQMKNKKNRGKCHRKRSKKLLNLLRVLGGKLTLAPPHMLPATFFSGILRFLGSLG